MRQTCRKCNRNVMMVDDGGGNLVATETSVIDAIPMVRAGSSGGGFRAAGPITPARQLHAALCDQYVEQARKERIAREQREYNQAQARSGRRNHGL